MMPARKCYEESTWPLIIEKPKNLDFESIAILVWQGAQGRFKVLKLFLLVSYKSIGNIRIGPTTYNMKHFLRSEIHSQYAPNVEDVR